MTREEEIIIEFEAAANYRYNDDAKSLIISAMEWADEHPRKGLVDIEKACEWLRAINTPGIEVVIEDFRKAMEDSAKRYATHYDRNFNGTNDGYIAENEKEAYIAGAKDVLEKIESLIKSTNGDDEVYHYNLYIRLQELVKELKG